MSKDDDNFGGVIFLWLIIGFVTLFLVFLVVGLLWGNPESNFEPVPTSTETDV